MKTIRNIALTIMCLCVLTGVTMHIEAAGPEPLKVGAGQTYATLNEAIASAGDGQVIQLVGSVTETNPASPVVIDKRVVIQGDGASVYTVKGWAKEVSPFQIKAAGVIIQDLNVVINGAATTCSPIEITGNDLSLKRTSITLTGTTATVFAPVLVNASGLTMEEVTIPGTVRAPVLVDLLGNSAVLKNVSITTGVNTTGLYSATSPASLVLDACSFTATANTATPVSLPAPDGLTLTDCTFSFTFSGTGTGCGINFTEASTQTATKTFQATSCVFNMNAVATAIHLNGYNGVFRDCEFNYARGGTAIFSQAASNADLTFTHCAFYIGKNSGEKPTYAKGLDLQNNEQGNLVIDGCTLVASCDPAAATGASAARIISATNSTMRSLTIHNSSITLDTGANTATGVDVNAEYVTITNSRFKANAKTAQCVIANSTALGMVSGNTFDIAQAASEGLRFTDATVVSLKNNIYELSTAGTGTIVTNAAAGSSVVVSEQNKINLQGQASQGLLIENVSKLDVRNGNTIKAVGGGKNSVGIKANQVREVEVDGVAMDVNGATHGIAVDGTKFPQGTEGSARITNTSAQLSGGNAKAISVIYANGVLIDRFYGAVDDTVSGANLLSFNSSVGATIRNSAFEMDKSAIGINVAATTTVVEPLDENGLIKEHISGDYKIYNNQFYVGESARAIFFGGKDTHNVAIHDNRFNAHKSIGIVTVGYGRSQMVYRNVFESVDSTMAVVSDGVDETTTFSMETDSDIYAGGGIVEAYRNQIYNNQLKGSYERGFYITNNGDVVRDNDFSEATFQYESVPGTVRNVQVLVAYCKDVKILNNQFVQARAVDNPVIRVNNAVLSEITGNATKAVGGAPEVLFAQGADAVAPNGVKYVETITAHNATNTVNGLTPIEIVKEWSGLTNPIYEYILRIPEHPYTVAYYKDFVSNENLLAVEQGYSEFVEGHVLKASEIAADLGADWLTLHRPDGYPDEIASNIGDLIITSNAAENVVIVVYLQSPAIVTEPNPSDIQPSVRRRASTPEPNEAYVEIDENEVPLAPPEPTNPNPQTGKNGVLSACIGAFILFLTAAYLLWFNHKRKQMNTGSK